jgi:hypothetical protein
LLQSILIKEDFPTLLLPINANSGLSGLGHLSNEGLLIKYFASFISIVISGSGQLPEAQRCIKSLNWEFNGIRHLHGVKNLGLHPDIIVGAHYSPSSPTFAAHGNRFTSR